MIKGIRHTGYNCHDLGALDYFWQKVMGFKLIWDQVENPSFMGQLWGMNRYIATRKYQAPDGHVLEFGLVPVDRQHVSLAHIGLVTDDIEAEYKHLSELGWHFISPPVLSPDGHGKLAVFFGPDGVAIELVQILSDWMKEAGSGAAKNEYKRT